MDLLKEINDRANIEDTAEEVVNEMSFTSDLARRMQGKVTGKQQIRRVALGALQMTADTLEPKALRKFIEEAGTEGTIEFLNQRVRKEVVRAIEMIKAVED